MLKTKFISRARVRRGNEANPDSLRQSCSLLRWDSVSRSPCFQLRHLKERIIRRSNHASLLLSLKQYGWQRTIETNGLDDNRHWSLPSYFSSANLPRMKTECESGIILYQSTSRRFLHFKSPVSRSAFRGSPFEASSISSSKLWIYVRQNHSYLANECRCAII